MDLLGTESFDDAFGKKSKRKRPKLGESGGVKFAPSYFSLVTTRSDLSGLLSAAETRGEAYNADHDSQLTSNQQVHCLLSLSISCSRTPTIMIPAIIFLPLPISQLQFQVEIHAKKK